MGLIEDKRYRNITNSRNFEELALSMIGRELYEAFILGYTKKQWECDPVHLPASILKRLPIVYNYNDNYYNKTYQGIPEKDIRKLLKTCLTIIT